MKKALVFVCLFTLFQTAVFAQPGVISHRGSWKNTQHPQNSIAALQAAIDQKVWGSEFDVHLTKDDILVVNHDHDFYGLEIEELTYEELLAKKHPNGESISTAREYLEAGLKQKNTKLIFELKTSRISKERTMEAVAQSLKLVKEFKAQKQVEFIAFDWDACLKYRELDKKVKIHYLNGDKTPTEVAAAKLTGIDYHVNIFKKNPGLIQDFKDLGLKTNSWTVNQEEDMELLIENGIDYITTDEPELLNRLLNKI